MRVAILLLVAISGRAQVGSLACARCHAEIYRKYMATGMARSSGQVGTGRFTEKLPANAGAYRVTREKDSFRMQFTRPSAQVNGVRDLKWFIGSGNVGRSYAFSVDGFLFQAPVSYYSSVARWDLSPGYAGKPTIELAKPIEEPCLTCHASRPQLIPNHQNRYLDPPFLEAGIGCERCHGGGTDHAVVNPAKLDAARRDSICQQCHLTGAARVPRPGRGVGTFRPGELLSDHLAVFVWDQPGGERAATDHSEQLARSKCKLASGDRLWCGSCHDPHSEDTAKARVSCQGCHAPKACTSPATSADCVSCHMPKARSREGEHVAYTDHTISRRPAPPPAARDRRLRSFWRGEPAERDLAIALASRGQPDLPLLEKLRGADDAPVLVQLAQLYDAQGKQDPAEALYERVLRLDPSNAAAGANLAIYRARKGRTQEAIALWQDVFERNPALAGAGINLAVAQSGAGDRAGARRTIDRLLQFHPDLDAVRQLRQTVR
jgi:hypothetical protein